MSLGFSETEYQKQYSPKRNTKIPISFNYTDDGYEFNNKVVPDEIKLQHRNLAESTETSPEITLVNSETTTNFPSAKLESATQTAGKFVTLGDKENLSENAGTQTANVTQVSQQTGPDVPVSTRAQVGGGGITKQKAEWFNYGNGNTSSVTDKQYLNSFNSKAPAAQVYPSVSRKQAQQESVRHFVATEKTPAAGLPSSSEKPPKRGVVFAEPRYLDFAQDDSAYVDSSRAAKALISAQAPSEYQSEYKREFLNWNLPLKQLVPPSETPSRAAALETPLRIVDDIQPAGLQSRYRQEQYDRRLNRLHTAPTPAAAIDHLAYMQVQRHLQNAKDVENGFLEELQRLEKLRDRQRRV